MECFVEIMTGHVLGTRIQKFGLDFTLLNSLFHFHSFWSKSQNFALCGFSQETRTKGNLAKNINLPKKPIFGRF